MKLNIRQLPCTVVSTSGKPIKAKNGKDEDIFISSSHLKYEAQMTRTKALQVLRKLAEEEEQGDLNSLLDAMLDYAWIDKIPLSMKYPSNAVAFSIAGKEVAQLGDSLTMASVVLEPFGNNEVKMNWVTFGHVSSKALSWLNDNAKVDIAVTILGPGAEDPDSQENLNLGGKNDDDGSGDFD